MGRSWKKDAFSTSPQAVESDWSAGGAGGVAVSPVEKGGFAGSSPAALWVGLLFLLQEKPRRGLRVRWW